LSKSKLIIRSCFGHQNARQYHNIKTAIKPFKSVAKFKQLGMALTN